MVVHSPLHPNPSPAQPNRAFSYDDSEKSPFADALKARTNVSGVGNTIAKLGQGVGNHFARTWKASVRDPALEPAGASAPLPGAVLQSATAPLLLPNEPHCGSSALAVHYSEEISAASAMSALRGTSKRRWMGLRKAKAEKLH